MPILKSTLITALFFLMAGNVFAQTKTPPKTHLDGKKLYSENCLSCHQEDGGGVTSMNPPLIKTSYVLGDKSEIVKIVLKGFGEKVKIQGKYYSNIMPSLSYLKDDQIAAILTYVRSHFENTASAISAEEVKEIRAKLKN